MGGDIVWVLLVGQDYEGEGVCGVYSEPGPAVAAAEAMPEPVTGGRFFDLEAHRVNSDEALPSFRWQKEDGWKPEYDDKSWQGVDAGVSYMLALCEVEEPSELNRKPGRLANLALRGL